MAEIIETPLPGVGTRHDFACRVGPRVGVITRYSGRRELVVYDRRDPDAVAAVLELTPDESRTLADLLGGTVLTEQLRAAVRSVDGLAIDWLTLPDGFPGGTVGTTDLRARTGVSIIAVVRAGDDPVPAPGPDTELRAGDVIVVTGTGEGIRQAEQLLGI